MISEAASFNANSKTQVAAAVVTTSSARASDVAATTSNKRKHCGKLMTSIQNKNWTGGPHGFTFGHGLEQTWLH
jgi:hypothetical protein